MAIKNFQCARNSVVSVIGPILVGPVILLIYKCTNGAIDGKLG